MTGKMVYPIVEQVYCTQKEKTKIPTVKRLLMRPHSYKNHNFSILKNTTKIDCLWIYFLHFFPLYNKLVNNRINHLSCHCRFIYTIKHFNVNQLCPHHLTQIRRTAHPSAPVRFLDTSPQLPPRQMSPFAITGIDTDSFTARMKDVSVGHAGIEHRLCSPMDGHGGRPGRLHQLRQLRRVA